MFTDKIDPIISNGVETIGENDIIPIGIVTVSWSWTDNEVKLHTKKLNNILYFTESPVYIRSAPALAKSIKDDEGTWVFNKNTLYFYLEVLVSTNRQYLNQNISPIIRYPIWI